MKTKLIAGFLLAGSCLFAAPRISIGIGVGLPAPVYVAPAPAYLPPPVPAPVAGYWYGVGPGRVWRPGYRAAYFGPRAHFRR